MDNLQGESHRGAENDFDLPMVNEEGVCNLFRLLFFNRSFFETLILEILAQTPAETLR